MNRLETFLACKHSMVQDYTNCCLQCGENLYITEEEIRKAEGLPMKPKPSTPTVVDGVLSYDVWYKPGGGGMINRDYLDHDHPQHTYNYLKSHGIKPEDFGIWHPVVELMKHQFEGKTRKELILEIIELRRQVESYERILA